MEDEYVERMHFCREDTVVRVGNPSMIGVILRLGGDAEVDSSSEESESDDDDEDTGVVPEGRARVCWSTAEETTEELSDINVIDRAFLHGDIVALSSDPLGQSGTIVNLEMYADVEYPNGEVLKNVNSRQLRRIRPFMVGDYVVRDHWIGRVEQVVDNVTVVFDDGAKCKVTRADPGRLAPVVGAHHIVPGDQECFYYPGLRVRASSSLLYKGARWLRGSWKASRMEGIVSHVDAGSLMVYWIGVGNAGGNDALAPVPSEHQDPKSLIKLVHFSHLGWQLGDRSLPPKLHGIGNNNSAPSRDVAPSDGETSMASMDNEAVVLPPPETTPSTCNSEPSSGELPQENSTVYRRKPRRCTLKREKRKSKKKDQTYEAAVVIVRTKTLADVVWQDGSKVSGIPCSSLIAVQYLGENDFWPEQYVLERGSDGEGEDTGYRRVGVVKTVDAKERTAKVRWLKPAEPQEFDTEETVSVYEILEHPDYSYCLGDVVIRLHPVEEASSTSISAVIDVALEPKDSEKSELEAEEKEKYFSRKENVPKRGRLQESQDLSWVGAIVGLSNGDIEVEWANGTISKVGPQAIFVVNRDEEDDESSDDEDVDDAASWETVDSDHMSGLESDQVAYGRDDQAIGQAYDDNVTSEAGSDNTGNPQGGALSLAFGIVSRLISTVLGLRAKKVAVGEPSLQVSLDRDDAENEDPSEEEHYKSAMESLSSSMENIDLSQKAKIDDESLPINSNTESTSTEAAGALPCLAQFKHFDVVKDASDHHFVCEASQVSNQRKWLRKVQQEWSILENNLPDTIFVRMYEDRMDLLRAVILGATGTPYHDGLFVFDLFLPPEYPNVPPVVHYHSGGLRLNPNLYENGKVCLSLLNTWTGKGSELWNPGTSNVLQVLVSIQGLVLNSKPYFNEAGYERQTGTGEGEKNSISYNENTFLLSCKSILYLLRRPPMHLEELVRNHFRYRAVKLLSSCKAYLEGLPVGYLTEDGEKPADLDSESGGGSAGFKLMLSKLVPKLVTAFVELGCTGCEGFLHSSNDTVVIT